MQERKSCSYYRCKSLATREVGLTRTLPYCDKDYLQGSAWGRVGMCSRCEGALDHSHHHITQKQGHPTAMCCDCFGECAEKGSTLKDPVHIDWSMYDTEEEDFELPESEATGGGYLVMASGTGKTAHSVKSRDPLEAVCMTRTIRTSKEPRFFSALPSGVGHCWKCVKGI